MRETSPIQRTDAKRTKLNKTGTIFYKTCLCRLVASQPPNVLKGERKEWALKGKNEFQNSSPFSLIASLLSLLYLAQSEFNDRNKWNIAEKLSFTHNSRIAQFEFYFVGIFSSLVFIFEMEVMASKELMNRKKAFLNDFMRNYTENHL